MVILLSVVWKCVLSRLKEEVKMKKWNTEVQTKINLYRLIHGVLQPEPYSAL